jgi:serine/threonine protein phosphatase PrpC
VPDIVLDGADLGGLTVRAASLRGDDHRYYGEPRQDSVALWPLVLAGANTVLACVADGVGSQPNSHLGSDLVCSSLRDQIEREAETWTWDGFGGLASGILERVAAKMACYAEEHRLPPKTLSSTLVAAVVAVDPVDGRRRFVVMRLGDSTAFLLQGGKLSEFGSPKTAGGQVVDSVTEALPGDPRAVIMAQGELSRGDVLILCSDGLSDPMGNGEVKEQLIKWWSDEEVPGILEFGWQLGFRAKSFGDDRSAVCIWGR